MLFFVKFYSVISDFIGTKHILWDNININLTHSSINKIITSYVAIPIIILISSQWRHNERNGDSNHRRLACLHSRLFRRRSKKTSKLRVTGFSEWNPPVTDGFPSQRACNEESASVWWRHRLGLHIRPPVIHRTPNPQGDRPGVHHGFRNIHIYKSISMLIVPHVIGSGQTAVLSPTLPPSDEDTVSKAINE